MTNNKVWHPALKLWLDQEFIDKLTQMKQDQEALDNTDYEALRIMLRTSTNPRDIPRPVLQSK